MAYTTLDALNEARRPIEERRNALYARPGTDQWDARFLQADNERLRQLSELERVMQDPSWTAQVDRQADSAGAAARAQDDEGYRQAEGQRRARGAATGTAGGSYDAVIAGQNAQRLAAARAQVNQQVAELKAAGIRDADAMGRELLDQILAGPDDQGSMGTALDGQRANIQSQQQMANLESQFRGAMANSIAGFVQNGVTPAVTGGFQAANTWNDNLRDQYRDDRDTGAFRGSFADWQQSGGDRQLRSWWGY